MVRGGGIEGRIVGVAVVALWLVGASAVHADGGETTVPETTVPETTVPAPAPPTPTGSGIRILPHGPEHDVALGLEYTGFALVGAGVLTLVVVGVLTLVDVFALGCSAGSIFDPAPGACGSGVPIPLEAAWTALGANAVGAILASVGLGLDATRPASMPSASLRLTVHF